MHIPLTCLFLAGSALFAASPTSAAQNSYSEGLALSRQSGRPLVVFVAASTTGERASMDGKLTPAARKILTEQYVYVVLDAKADRALIDAFGIHQDNGFVISDRSLELQAYIHHGTFGPEELVRLLQAVFGSEPGRRHHAVQRGALLVVSASGVRLCVCVRADVRGGSGVLSPVSPMRPVRPEGDVRMPVGIPRWPRFLRGEFEAFLLRGVAIPRRGRVRESPGPIAIPAGISRKRSKNWHNRKLQAIVPPGESSLAPIATAACDPPGKSCRACWANCRSCSSARPSSSCRRSCWRPSAHARGESGDNCLLLWLGVAFEACVCFLSFFSRGTSHNRSDRRSSPSISSASPGCGSATSTKIGCRSSASRSS